MTKKGQEITRNPLIMFFVSMICMVLFNSSAFQMVLQTNYSLLFGMISLIFLWVTSCRLIGQAKKMAEFNTKDPVVRQQIRWLFKGIVVFSASLLTWLTLTNSIIHWW